MNIFTIRTPSWKLALMLWLGLGASAVGANKVWTGGAGNGFWSAANNWSAAGVPAAGDALFFSGAVGTINTNDLAGGFSAGSLTFSNGNFLIGGDSLSFATATGITNLAGNNEVSVDLSFPSLTSTFAFNVGTNSRLCLSGNSTNLVGNGNAGFFNKVGYGSLVLRGGNHAWNAAGFLRNGDMILDGGTVVATNNTNGNLRITCNVVGGTARLVLTNGATLALTRSDGSMLIGRSGTNGNNVVDIYDGTLSLPGSDGRIVLGQDAGNSAAVNQYGGLVAVLGTNGSGGEVRVGYTGTNLTAVYNLNGGRLQARVVIKSITNNAGIFNFNGGTLEPTGSTNNFMQNLTAVNVQNGGAVIDTHGFDAGIGAPLQAGGTGGLAKWGAGTLTLNGSNSYTGPTGVNEGGLCVNGTLGPGAVNVAGTLSGSGIITGAVSVAAGGVLAPGGSIPGRLTCGDTVSLQGETVVRLSRTLAQPNDAVAAAGIRYGGQLTVSNVGAALAGGDTFRLFESTNLSGAFEAIALPALESGMGWSNRLALDGSIMVVVATNEITPRPKLLARTNYNILFIPVDDLKPLIGAFGDPGGHPPNYPMPKTPNLDRLAARGMIFTRAYCQMAVCSPSRSSLMTGLRPDTTGVWDLVTHFRSNIFNTITLGQHMGMNGYRTYGIGKIFHGGYDDPPTWTDGAGFPRGAHTYYETNSAYLEDTNKNTTANAADCGGIDPRTGRVVTDEFYNDGVFATNALDKLRFYAGNYQSNGTPFFLAVGFLKPHLPFNAPKKYWDLYDPNDIDVTAYDGNFRLPTNTLDFTRPGSTEPTSYTYIGDTLSTAGSVPTQEQARHLIHGYMACVSFTDANVGKLLDALDTYGVASNTIVVLWGDHGWHLGDHGAFWAKHSNFEQATRAPLFVSVPGMAALGTAGKRCNTPVEYVDIYPTLVDLCGLPGPAQPPGLELQGTSFAPLLEDPAQPWKKGAISQYTRNITGSGIAHPGNGMGYSLRTQRYRYTEWWRTQTGTNRAVKIYGAPEYAELYDYVADPAESVNQASNPAYTNVLAELKTALAGGLGWSDAKVKPPASYPVTWTNWQAAQVQPGYPLNTFDEDNDPDQDGAKNLAEYAFGAHPLNAETNLVNGGWQNLQGSNWLWLQYPKVPLRLDVSVVGSYSTNLKNWTTSGVVNEVVTNATYVETWRARVPMTNQPGMRGFLRIEIRRQ